MKTLAQSLIVVLAYTGAVLSHGDDRPMHPREIASRQLAANERHIVARNCAPQIAEYQRKRKLAKRATFGKRATDTATALEPHESTIKNTTCVTAPEVTEGPYYLNNDLVRQDVRENQGGILLELDIGVIDTSTCQPLPNVLVEIWHANATGAYSGFTTAMSSESGNTSGNTTADMSAPAGSMSMSGGGGASPSGAMPSGGTGGGSSGGGGSATKTDSFTFLRGGWETNSEGIVTFNSVYPGFYTGRTIHIHTMVHQNITYNSNGTYTSRSGSLLHIGQMFFTDELSNEVMALNPYNSTTMTRSYNADDSILAQENSNGYSGYVDASLIGSDISDGVLGFITLGVDSRASYQVTSENFYTGGDPYELVTPSSTGMVTVRSSTTASGSGSTAALSDNSSSSGAISKFGALKWMRLITRAVGI